jgi:hypothetical protein
MNPALDKLIDFYEAHKPGAASELPVGVTRATVMKWGIKPEKRGAPIVYRSRTLITKQPRAAK